jgi:hypothetical protein
MFNVKKIRKAKKSEIDAILTVSKKMTPDEVREYLHKRFVEDFQVFQRLIMEEKEGSQWIRNQPQVKPLFEKVENFYNDLISDGYIKKDFSLFESDKLEEWKWSQSRDEAVSLLRELDKNNYEDYQKVFRKWNRVYANEYETIITTYLIEPAQKICGRRIRNKACVLNTLSFYKNGKYAELFRNLIPQIRNSIQHQDFIIDPKQPKITFYDSKKPPLTLTLEEYSEIFWEPFFLTLAFDIAWFDLRLGIIEILLEAIYIVDEFFKKREYKLMPVEGGLSILDWALLIKSGKISE